MRLNSRDRVPCGQPKGWRDQQRGFYIGWPCNVTFESFVGTVRNTYTNNNLTPPSEEQIEEAICHQIPKSFCNGAIGARRATGPRPPPIRSTGCARCGKKK